MKRTQFKARKVFFKSFLFHILFVFITLNVKAEVTYALPLSGAEFEIGNMLEWSTSLELNSERFIIQRSLDGISYEDIGRVDAMLFDNGERRSQ